LLNGKRILITGGTGSFGQAFVHSVLQQFPLIERLVIYSRGELCQFEMAQRFSPQDFPALRYFIGDVRDSSRLKRAMEGIDIVIHAAALKQVPAAEYNPFEAIKTNVLGAQNVIEAALDSPVTRVVTLSTDKAAAPINLYGATKLCSDKLFVAASNMKGDRDICFSVVRYGNVLGSRGSVIPFFLERKKTGVLPITDPRMTRFNISLTEGVQLVLHALEHSLGGEIYVPKIPSYRIMDLAEAIGPNCQKPIVGIRPGEKLHEEMITRGDSPHTLETDKLYLIVPNSMPAYQTGLWDRYAAHHQGVPVEDNFRYSSGENHQWLSVEQIRELIRTHLDPHFSSE
jgi:UDP-N-acetylglucosamine 4,6-dehydratase